MLYTPLTKLAMRIAFDAHRDQVDKSGLPYIFHPFHLAEGMEDETSACVALLHDVIEDSETTLDELIAAGFPPAVTDALALLTHDPAEPYMRYVARIRENPVARRVKLADLAHNSDLTRLDGEPNAYTLARVQKYKEAITILEA